MLSDLGATGGSNDDPLLITAGREDGSEGSGMITGERRIRARARCMKKENEMHYTSNIDTSMSG